MQTQERPMVPTDEFGRSYERMSKCPYCERLNFFHLEKKRPWGFSCDHYLQMDIPNKTVTFADEIRRTKNGKIRKM